jgi:hypothetical protein
MAEPGKPSCRLPDRHCEMPFLACEESRGSITSTAAGFLLGAGAGATPARAAGVVSTAPVFAGSTQPSSRITIRVRRAVGSVRSTYPASVLCGCRSEAELVSLVSSPRLHPRPASAAHDYERAGPLADDEVPFTTHDMPNSRCERGDPARKFVRSSLPPPSGHSPETGIQSTQDAMNWARASWRGTDDVLCSPPGQV